MPSASQFRSTKGVMAFASDPWFGNHWFVNSGNTSGGLTASFGFIPQAPWLTLAAAFDSGLLASGDIVHVAPGHAEVVSAAAGIDADTAGIYVKGYGDGTLRPSITFDTADTADIDIDAANITFDNFRFRANFADVAAAIDVNAADFTLRNCLFDEVAASMNVLIWVLGATANTSPGIVIENCRMYGIDTIQTHFVSLPGTSDRCVIQDNILIGAFETSCIGAAGAVTKIAILRNVIQNIDTDADSCILLAASSTGIVAYNGVGAALAADATTSISCSTGVVLIENYSVDTGDRQGVLDPIAT